MKQPLQKFEFATSILRFAKDHDIPKETVKEAIELLHRDLCPKKEPMILNVPPINRKRGSWL